MRSGKERKRQGVFELIKRYIDIKVDYFQLLAVEKISVFVSNIMLMVIFGALGFLLFCFFLLLTHQLLMSFMGIPWLVSLIEIAVILFTMLLLWICRNKLILKPIADSVVRILLDLSVNQKRREEDEDEE